MGDKLHEMLAVGAEHAQRAILRVDGLTGGVHGPGAGGGRTWGMGAGWGRLNCVSRGDWSGRALGA